MNKILLLSIRPEFSRKIFSGEKRVELRRLRPSVHAGDLVLVYTSSPSCELTGAFVVSEVCASTPDKLWAQVRGICSLTRQQYDGYYLGSPKAYGIMIERAWKLETPLKLANLRLRSARFHPPQSYQYFAPGDLNSLMPALAVRGLLTRGREPDGTVARARKRRHQQPRRSVSARSKAAGDARALSP